MPTSMTVIAGEFLYKNSMPLDADKHGTILVGEIEQGTAVRGMHLQVGSRTIPILAVEGYGNAAHVDQGFLVLTTALEDVESVQGKLSPNTKYFVLQSIPMAPSPMESSFRDGAWNELIKTALQYSQERT